VAGVRQTVAICGALTTLGALFIYWLTRKRLSDHQHEAQ
jgi:uncharacterized oligopeptide transporter (OPT) family protein